MIVKRVTREQNRSRWGCFDPMDPCIEVDLGQDFVVECHTYGKGVIWKVGDELGEDKLCLPIAVRGVLPGDTIAIRIKRTEIVGNAVAGIDGPLEYDEDFAGRAEYYILPTRNGFTDIPGGFRIRLTPTLGHINVEPLDPETPNPWYCGGNMDLVEVCEGNTVYLKAEKEGAKLVLGDSKAHVVEGEMAGEGIQAALDVTLNVIKSRKIRVERPFIESPTHWISVGIHREYWEAVKQAVWDLIRIVQDLYSLDFTEAYFWVTHFAHVRNGAIWVMGGREFVDAERVFDIPRTVTIHLAKPMKTPEGGTLPRVIQESNQGQG